MGGKRSATQGEGDSISYEWINETSGITGHEDSVALRLRRTKNQRRSTHRIAEPLPFAASLMECSMQGENFGKGAGDVGAHHGTHVDLSKSHWLNPAVAPFKEVEI